MRTNSNTPDNFYDASLRTPGVYSIKCTSTGKVYVGSAVNISLRWRGHFRHLTCGTHHCEYLQRAWRKYGPDAFQFAVIESGSKEQLRMREQFYIDTVPVEQRFNSTPTAGSLLGFKMNPQSLERMRVAHTGFRHSEETKARVSAARKGIAPRPAGWKMSEEGRRKISAARSGRALSPEHRTRSIEILNQVRPQGPRTEQHKAALANSGRILSDEQVIAARQKYSGGQPMHQIAEEFGVSRKAVNRAIRGDGLIYANIGKPITEFTLKRRPPSEEHRQKLSAATKGRPKSEATRENMRQAWARRKAAM